MGAAPLKKASRWFRAIVLSTYVLAILWTSLFHTIETRAIGNPVAVTGAENGFRVTYVRHGPLDVRQYVQEAARAEGVNPRVAEWIVSHESQHHPDAIGDGGESRGLWQINKAWHPEVSDACAYNVPCSTTWSLERIRAGYANEWSTWKYCRAWFEDCPF